MGTESNWNFEKLSLIVTWIHDDFQYDIFTYNHVQSIFQFNRKNSCSIDGMYIAR